MAADDYLRSIPDRAVAPTKAAISALCAFDEQMPEHGSGSEETVDLLARLGSPAATATAGPRFFGLVVGGTLPAALSARILTSAWDQIVFDEQTSPVGVKIEQVAGAWILDLLELPKTSSISFVTGATMGNLTCLAAARSAILTRLGWDVERQGLRAAPEIPIYIGEQAHVSVLKVLRLLGIGDDCPVRLRCDEQGRIDPAHLPHIEDDAIVIAQAGNVNSGAMDPFAALRAHAPRAWIHVDGAFGLWANALPSLQPDLKGVEDCDSWVVDGHKWLNTPYDCGMAICRHPDWVKRSMSTQAAYLFDQAECPKDMGPEFSRSARAVEVWAALRSLGRDGLIELIERCCRHARLCARGLEELGFTVLNDIALNQVVATVDGEEEHMPELARRVRESGKAWFGSTNFNGRSAIRLSFASWATRDEDIECTLTAIKASLESLHLDA